VDDDRLSRAADPRTVAERFAGELTTLLNKTVCDDAYVGVTDRGDGTVAYGTGMWPKSPAQDQRLRTTGDCPCWLRIVGQLFLDGDGYLTVAKSAYVVSAGNPPAELFHYDYERNKADYPDAHMQVIAGSPAWDDFLTASGKKEGSLSKLHLPVGGKRYRPALEDILEALIAEHIVDPKPGWDRALNESRDEFRRRQLRAAIRRDPDTAIAALRDRGYTVYEPDRSADVIDLASRERRWPPKLGRGRRGRK
jgi:hypothetical protein